MFIELLTLCGLEKLSLLFSHEIQFEMEKARRLVRIFTRPVVPKKISCDGSVKLDFQ
jgi:hypothetical protein